MVRLLLERALAAAPDNPVLYAKLAGLLSDRFDFAGAADAYAKALARDPDNATIRSKLAACLNKLERYHEALAVLGAVSVSSPARGSALVGLGRMEAAEAEFRAVLAAEPNDRVACAELCRMLRKSGRLGDLLELCQALHDAGSDNAQLFSEWGRALALTGDFPRARQLLFDPARVLQQTLPVPDGFDTLDEFNTALSEEILSHPNADAPFPPRIEANRGSRRVHALFAGKRPELFRLLLDRIQTEISAYIPEPSGGFDPWSRARPAQAHLRPWALIQYGDAYEEWHNHRGGWLSGVYYVRVPAMVTTAGAGPGCIEFGPPPSLYDVMPELVPRWRHAPTAGTFLLTPSHYVHRTIPTGADAYRVSFAFDVVAHRNAH